MNLYKQNSKMDIDSELIFVSPISRIMQQKKKVTEGGAARYNAWDVSLRKLKEETDNVRIIELTGKNRLLRLIRVLLFSKRKRIFLLYPHAGIRLDRSGMLYELLSNVFLTILKVSSFRNSIIFDVSDLKYEQAIDLELSELNIRHLRHIEKKLFSWKRFRFIFASLSMKEYAQKKYGIDISRSWDCMNGGNIIDGEAIHAPISDFSLENDRIHYVYSGTLNKGRNIEKMLTNFPDNDSVELILMGKGGEWINDEYGHRRNIRYIGEVAESIAHSIVACCDVGLIPYDQSRLYYNIAFPTKLSFYITAGIPYLSTPTKEVCRFNDLNVGIVSELEKWDKIIEETTIESINQMKKNAIIVRPSFSWKEVLNCPWLGT